MDVHKLEKVREREKEREIILWRKKATVSSTLTKTMYGVDISIVLMRDSMIHILSHIHKITILLFTIYGWVR